MKNRNAMIAAVAVSLAVAAPLIALAKGKLDRPAPPPTAQAAYDEMKGGFGIVPSFAMAVPEGAIGPAWDELKAIEFADGALPSKIKSLISLSVAAQIPCKYCIYADTQFAKAAGITDEEIREAVMVSALTRHWSTWLNGIQPDETAFKKEVDGVVAFVKSGKGKPPTAPAKDAAEAQAQMKDLMGKAPSFFASFPASGLAGAWNSMVAVQIAPTKLEGKYRELVGIAVAAQIPCKYCVYFHTSFAKLMGASDAEIGEAIAEAALTREWSTVINGANIDEVAFRKEIDGAVKFMAKQQAQASRQK